MEITSDNNFTYTIDITNIPKHVKEKTYKYSNNNHNTVYKIYNYDRDMICDDNKELYLYKSIICNNENNIVGFCPPKSVKYNKFIESNEMNDNIIASQLIEGTMINLFYDKDRLEWNIHTRGAVGGNYFYFRNQYYVDQFSENRQISFYDMFLECLQSNDNENLNDLSLLNCLSKDFVYSFVMQHPDNHIVVPHERPQLYLTHVYKIVDNTITHINNFFNNEELKNLEILNGFILTPEIYNNEDSFDKMVEKYCNIQKDFTNIGISFYNTVTGERSVYKNPSYVIMKELRGNNPNLQYQYICLRRINKVKDFLQYFPNYKKVFWKFFSQYKEFMKNVHQSYYSYYIKKSISKVNNKYMPHIYRIHHNVFLPSLNTDNTKIINISEIYNYFDNIDIGELLYALNYDNRKITKNV